MTSTTATTPHVGRRTPPAWVPPALVGVAAVGACTVAGLTDSGDTWLPACPWKSATGLDCPGCGMTRGLRALVQGHPGLAVDNNLLLVLALPVLLLGWGVWMARSAGLTDRRIVTVDNARHWSTAIMLSLAAFWVLRLLPFEPFAWLASGRG
jgi:hypothetical protein